MAATEHLRELTTRSGFCFNARPAQPSDEDALAAFFTHVSPEDLRFRFLSAIRQVARRQVVAMTTIDHRQTENFLAFVDGEAEIIATAMLACDAAMKTGEVAIAIRQDYKGRGVGWVLLSHVSDYAEAKGLTTIQSLESRDNHAAITMERELGFVARACPDDATLMLVQKQLNQP